MARLEHEVAAMRQQVAELSEALAMVINRVRHLQSKR